MFGSDNRKTNAKLTVSFFLSLVVVTNSVPMPVCSAALYIAPAKVDAKVSQSDLKDFLTSKVNDPAKDSDYAVPRPEERSPSFSSPSSSGKKPKVETFAGPPLSFETNKGQADASVKFLAHSRGGGVLLSSRETTLVLSKTKADVKNAHSRSARSDPPSVTTLKMRFQGGNPDPKAIGLEELPGKTNYFLGNDASKWRTEIPNYKKVRYEAVYPGIDVVYYGNQNNLEYDFVVAPYANPNSIRIRFDDRCKLQISRNGDLLIAVDGFEVRQLRPIVYQDSQDGKIAVSGRYILRHREISFEIGAYDQSKPLIIDPVLSYSSYLWGIGGYDIALDSGRNMYIVGAAWGTGLTLVNPVQSTYAGNTDIYIQKFDPTGSTLLFSTYLGGNNRDDGNGYAFPSIAVDPAGNIYVRGTTSSTNFPTVNAIQPSFGGGLDAYVAKIAATGSQLIYSTYLGGSSQEEGGGLAVDQSGNAYVTGSTFSPNFPTHNPLMAPACNGTNRDVFVSVLNPTGSNFIYSTHIGGGTNQGDEAGKGIAVDAAGNAYVTGDGSSLFPTTPGAYQTTGGGGFILKINSDGSALLYSTHLSGANNSSDIAIDLSGNAYITGYTNGGLPTVNAFQPSLAGSSTDVFVAKLDATGSSLLYASYLGGTGSEFAGGIAVDVEGSAYLTGSTMGGFPLVNPVQSTMGGGGGFPDAFVTKVNASGTSLVFSTYLGGTGQDEGHAIAVDSDSNAYVTGTTNASTDFPKVNPYLSTGPGGFLSKYTGLKTYKISGHITANGAGFAGVTVNLTGAQTKTTQTDSNGDYIFNNLPSAVNYTVRPTKAGYLFSPTNQSFTNLSEDQIANFAAVFYSISGRVTDSVGAGLNGVTLTLSGTQAATTQTDPDGYYTFPTVAASGNYTLTPSKPDPILTYSFVPSSQTITGLNANQVINFSSSNSIISALNSTADAYVQDGTGANTNFGLATSLKVETDSKANNSKNFDAYLRFDVSGVSGNITSVKLRIFASSSTAAGATTAVYSVATTSWVESGPGGITWNNKPARSATALAGSNATINSTTPASYDLDITNHVRSEKNAGTNVITLALHNPSSSTVFVTLNSREATANKPQLVVTTSTSSNTAPSVALTNPVNGGSFVSPANITVSANATDSDGTISKVEFYAGTVPIGTATVAPYQITWGPVSAGSYSLTAVATDNLSATTVSSPVSINVNLPNIAPSITLDSPQSGTTFPAGSNIALVATAIDLDGTISKVEFFAGALLIGTATVPTSGAVYSVTWTNVNSGAYALTAKATDNLNGITSSSIVNINVVSQTGLSPIADAYVRDGASATTNFGTANELQTQVSSVGSNRETYIKFDITTVTGIVNAKLRLYGRLSDTSGTNVPATVYPVLTSAPDWVESGNGSITWNNKPAMGTALTSVTVIDNNARWYEWNIADYVKAEKDAGRNIIKLAIKNTAASTPYATFNSKEADSNRPQLILWTTQARNALLVANSTTLGVGDNAIKTRLQNQGYIVTVKGSGNNNAIQTSDANGKSVVLISSTVTSANVLAKFRHIPIPVIIWKSDLFDDQGMTGSTLNTDFGTATGQTQLAIVNSTHPLAAGLSASPTVSASSSFTWGNPNANAAKIATLVGDATKIVIFGYDNMAAMVGPNLDAPARRVGFFLTDLTANGLTADGNSLFDAAVKWATEVVTSPVISSLTPSIGLAGTQVSINGANFGTQQGTSTVTFNGASANVSSWNHTSVIVTVPAFASTGPVLVTVNGVASNALIFSVAGVDSDSDGLPDSWELQYFGNLNQSANGDPDGDGLTNLQEFQQGRNPTKSALADDGDFVNLKLYTPLSPPLE